MAEVTQRTFDLHSWKGLTEVLQIARNSRLSRADYAHFRDLVLSYAQEGGDQEKRVQIEKILARLETLPDPKSEEPTASEGDSRDVLRTAGRRIVPTFGVRKISVTHEAPSSPKEKDAHTDSVVSEKKSVVETKATSVPPPVRESTPEASKVVPSPLPEVSQNEDLIPAAIPKEVKQESPIKSLEEYRARIMEVKREVNARVGNPVTLIDAGNQVGRTYMNALLNAMKATNPGSTMNVVQALKDLEAAYEAVIAHVEGRTATPTSGGSESASAVTTPQPVAATSQPTSVVNVGDTVLGSELVVPHETSSNMEGAREESRIKAKDVVQPNAEAKNSDKTDMVTSRPRIPSLADIERATLPPENTITEKKDVTDTGKKSSFSLSSLVQKKSAVVTPLTSKPEMKEEVSAPSKSVLGERDSSVTGGNQSTNQKMGETSGTRPVVSGGRHIPPVPVVEVSKLMPTKPETLSQNLMTPEVTASLGQLLSEWNLFASSGLFGTGPGGFEHPLYKKLREEKMEEVILGRWDGASPKITGAIRDYIDAWRHEQGVAYNPTETFEHYLRRVVDRILKRQKGIRGV